MTQDEQRKLIGPHNGPMERDTILSGKPPAWLWCLHCGRCYPHGHYRVATSGRGVNARDLEMCPYKGCDGDTVMDAWPWSKLADAHPSYPKVPILGVVYSNFGPPPEK